MNLKNVKKDWKTSLAAVIGGLIILAGLVWPDTINAETGEAINAASGQIIVGIGSLITIITGLVAKDK